MPYSQQLAKKQRRLAALLPAVPYPTTVGSRLWPLLGIADADGWVDLCACPLYPASFAPVFTVVKQFIPCAGGADALPCGASARRTEILAVGREPP